MNILIIGGMHGNETLGIELVKMLQNNPIDGIDAVIANDIAVKDAVRFTGKDLNRSFPGTLKAVGYEERRAAELVLLCKKYDVVLDFHNTYCSDNDCSFVGETASKALLSVSSELGLKRVIVADYDCLNKYAANCISIEVSMDSKQNDATIWYEKVKNLQKATLSESSDIETYRFVYRMTLEDRDRLQLDTKNLKAFQRMNKELAEKLGVNSPAYPIFVGDAFTPYNYGGILNKI